MVTLPTSDFLEFIALIFSVGRISADVSPARTLISGPGLEYHDIVTSDAVSDAESSAKNAFTVRLMDSEGDPARFIAVDDLRISITQGSSPELSAKITRTLTGPGTVDVSYTLAKAVTEALPLTITGLVFGVPCFTANVQVRFVSPHLLLLLHVIQIISMLPDVLERYM